MKKLLFVLAIVVVSASASFAQNVTGGVRFDVILGNRPPSPVEVNLMRGEEAKHPNIAKSMHDIQDAMQHLKDAPSDFGGHKVQAENDLRQAWISLRKALYYNLYHDNQ